MKIGFVGLGIMGRPMAMNLLRSGHELYVNDLNPQAVQAVCAHGAKAADQMQIAQCCEAVFTILPNGNAVRKTMAKWKQRFYFSLVKPAVSDKYTFSIPYVLAFARKVPVSRAIRIAAWIGQRQLAGRVNASKKNICRRFSPFLSGEVHPKHCIDITNKRFHL